MRATRRSDPYAGVVPLLALALAVLALVSTRFGAVNIDFGDMAGAVSAALRTPERLGLTERIFLELRLPRTLACALVGASLALCGVLMQALFRNPIVEPGLVGTSSGAAFGAALYFVLGASFQVHAGTWTLPIAACLGAALATACVLLLAGSSSGTAVGEQSTTAVLLVGIAVNALFLSGVGFLSYIARDPQARSITFWNLGTLSGASWSAVGLLALVTVPGLLLALRLARPLNALMMGEEEAAALGVDVPRLKLAVIGLTVVLVAVATSITGVIGFVGLIVPHLLRLLRGSDHRFLVAGSAVAGGIVLMLADLIARVLLRPAELPIGIVTSAVGAPLFVALLRSRRQRFF
ncbi:iron ABC transporter permease [Aggregicoccus sp. 17bor-14]|uniref:FecCD family ABC transporter permease n=1 Tax=Myxococcaceae TaxID=31 RepID=UPI00129C7985|nr:MULTISPECIES: iron ABC transporter permease [Myxococcaceae]MBF5041924.1 iron ABC transporter permease [Simulacricoccus sp. 17bor-14]MRI87705.1 iron ABC transporter permease [Aggregicoccus sp. 17bor-14]